MYLDMDVYFRMMCCRSVSGECKPDAACGEHPCAPRQRAGAADCMSHIAYWTVFLDSVQHCSRCPLPCVWVPRLGSEFDFWTLALVT